MNPERIADYELVEYLTAGGMADLYLARSPRHAGPVVLKTIQRKYVEMTRVVRMFVDEGRIAKALDHPNIVRIEDVGEERGSYYIVMEFIGGRDLVAIARRGIEAGRFLPPHLAAAILAQVSNGLIYAHEKVDENGKPLRIVHCDISPGNIVVSFGGTAKIVDFGIARAAIQLRAEDQSVVGKFNYMAPEQIRGEALDARADLFSIGVILYELTVGRRLFRGKPADVKKRILAGDIPKPRDIRPELSEEMERIILRLLAIDRDERYGSARELRTDLLAHIAADGHPAGKREIAEYLRELFVPAVQRKAQSLILDENEAAGEDGTPSFEDDEELSLEAPVPGVVELIVDPDDPEPGPPPEATDPVLPSIPAIDALTEPATDPVALSSLADAEPVTESVAAIESVAAVEPVTAAVPELESEFSDDPTTVRPLKLPLTEDPTALVTPLPAPARTDPSTVKTSAEAAASATTGPHRKTHASASKKEVLLAVVAIGIALVLYLFLR